MSKAKKIRKHKKEEVDNQNNVVMMPVDKAFEELTKNENELEDIMENKNSFEYKGKTVNVIERAPFSAFSGAVDFVANACFDDGEYNPEIKRFAEKKIALLLYSDYEFTGDIDEQYEDVYAPELFYEVMKRADENQYYDLIGAIEAKIDFKLKQMSGGIEKKIVDLLGVAEKFLESMTDKFKDVSVEEIAEMAKAFSDLDEQKIVDLFVDKKFGDVETEVETEIGVEVDIEK